MIKNYINLYNDSYVQASERWYMSKRVRRLKVPVNDPTEDDRVVIEKVQK